MKFKLDELEDSEASLKKLKKRAESLASQIETREIQDNLGITMALNLRDLKSWDILKLLEGYRKSTSDRLMLQDIWRDNLDLEEFEKLFNIILNSAFIIHDGPAPGYQQGHEIIFKGIANNPDSFFYKSITPEILNRVINGRFWENLGRLNPALDHARPYFPVEQSLTTFLEQLNIAFVPRGLNLFKMNLGGSSSYLYGSEYSCLTSRAIYNYGKFLRQADSALYGLNLKQEDFAPAVNLYLDALEVKDRDDIFILDKSSRKPDDFVRKYKAIRKKTK